MAAQLPRYRPAPRPPGVGFSPRAVDTGQQYRALSQFGEAVEAASDEWKALEAERDKARQAAELTRATAAATRELNDLQLTLERDPDHATKSQRFEQGAAEIYGRYSEALSSQAARDLFERDWDALFEPKRVTVERDAFKGEVDETVAGLDAILPEYASAAAAAGSLDERNALLARGRVAIAGMAAAGYITDQDAVAREAKFLSSADEALARRTITSDPDAAIAALVDGKGFANLDETARARLIDMAAARSESLAKERARLAEKAERDAERQRREVAEGRLKEAYALDADGALTRDFVDGIRGDITPAEYKSLLKMLQPGGGAGGDDPQAFRDLQRLLHEDPGRAREAALSYHANGLISNETLKSVMGNARTFARQEGPKSEYERSRAFVRDALDPGPMFDPGERQRLAEGLDLFDRYAAEGDRSDTELRARAREIVDQLALVDIRGMRLALPRPRFGRVPAGGDLTAVAGAIEAAEQATVRKYRDGEIGDDELATEAEILERWRAWLDRQRAAQAPGGVK